MKRHPFLNALNVVVLLSFFCSMIDVTSLQAKETFIAQLPAPGSMVTVSPPQDAACLKGIIINPQNGLQFDFIVDPGNTHFNNENKSVEYSKLIKYFLASLAVPDKNQWVNLSPYEKNLIVEEDFGSTEMGQDLLAQDYLLKQITSSLLHPEKDLGKQFWSKIYTKMKDSQAITKVPMDAFNKIWIAPQKAVIYQKGNTAFILEHRLKVMLEEDYVSLKKHGAVITRPDMANAMRDIIIPVIEKEINEGVNFSPLRQVYSSMLLAAWYKRVLKQSLLGKMYVDQSKIMGIDQNPQVNDQIYKQYLQAYKKGVFNFIKEEKDYETQEMITRKYFSGGTVGWGESFDRAAVVSEVPDNSEIPGKIKKGIFDTVSVRFKERKESSESRMTRRGFIQALAAGITVASSVVDKSAANSKQNRRQMSRQESMQQSRDKKVIDDYFLAVDRMITDEDRIGTVYKAFMWTPFILIAGRFSDFANENVEYEQIIFQNMMKRIKGSSGLQLRTSVWIFMLMTVFLDKQPANVLRLFQEYLTGMELEIATGALSIIQQGPTEENIVALGAISLKFFNRELAQSKAKPGHWKESMLGRNANAQLHWIIHRIVALSLVQDRLKVFTPKDFKDELLDVVIFSDIAHQEDALTTNANSAGGINASFLNGLPDFETFYLVNFHEIGHTFVHTLGPEMKKNNSVDTSSVHEFLADIIAVRTVFNIFPEGYFSISGPYVKLLSGLLNWDGTPTDWRSSVARLWQSLEEQQKKGILEAYTKENRVSGHAQARNFLAQLSSQGLLNSRKQWDILFDVAVSEVKKQFNRSTAPWALFRASVEKLHRSRADKAAISEDSESETMILLLGEKIMPDAASMSEPENNSKGGIDFNSENMQMLFKDDAQMAQLSLSQQEMIRFNQMQGLVPEILEIKSCNFVMDLSL